MKKLLLGVLFMLVIRATASAAVADFVTFTLDVPDHWTIVREDGAATLLAPDRSAALSVVLQNDDGTRPSDLAKALSASMRGTKPKKEGEGHIFFFKNANGIAGKCIVLRDGDALTIITVTGRHPALNAIMASFRKKCFNPQSAPSTD